MKRLQSRRGNATLEYLILLVGVVVLSLSIVVRYGEDLEALWSGHLEDGFADLESEVGPDAGGDDGGGCSFYWNASTGRFHDPATNLFVSFDDAAAAGC